MRVRYRCNIDVASSLCVATLQASAPAGSGSQGTAAEKPAYSPAFHCIGVRHGSRPSPSPGMRVDRRGLNPAAIALPAVAAPSAGAAGAGAAGAAAAAGAVVGAAAVGYGVGTVANKGINWVLEHATGTSLGGLIYEACNEDSEDARCRKVLKSCREKCLDTFLDDPESLPGTGSDLQGRLKRCTRECMESQGCHNF